MKDKNTFIKQILEDIYNLPAPKLDEARRPQIFGMIDIVINGDQVIEYIVSDVSMKEHLEVFVYILTDSRLIIISIDAQNKIDTYPFPITAMQKVFFKSPKPEMISVEIHFFDNRMLGLKYPASKKEITDFFQSLDQLLTKRS